MSEQTFVNVFERYMAVAARLLPDAVDGKIVQDRKDPCTGITFPASMPMGYDSLQAILNQVIGRIDVVQQRPCVSSQRGDHWLDLLQHIVHCGSVLFCAVNAKAAQPAISHTRELFWK